MTFFEEKSRRRQFNIQKKLAAYRKAKGPIDFGMTVDYNIRKVILKRNEHERNINRLKTAIADKDSTISEMSSTIADKDNTITEMSNTIAELQATLSRVTVSFSLIGMSLYLHYK